MSSTPKESTVIHSSGKHEDFDIGVLFEHVKRLCEYPDVPQLKHVDQHLFCETIVNNLADVMTTQKLHELLYETAIHMVNVHVDYSILGGRLIASRLQRQLKGRTFSQVMLCFHSENRHDNQNCPLVSDDLIELVKRHHSELDAMVVHSRDYRFKGLSMVSMYESYVIKTVERTLFETPQYMYLRVALSINGHLSMDHVRRHYNLLSEGFSSHATPTLFNAGTPSFQTASCFLLTVKEDSYRGIWDTLFQVGELSKWNGGIGIDLTPIRARGSYVRGTNGRSKGVVPVTNLMNKLAVWIDQGGQKRKAAIAFYVQPWHRDFKDILGTMALHGKEELLNRNLFMGVWIPDIFMRRVQSNDTWTLFCPTKTPALLETFGEEFDRYYEQYERDNEQKRLDGVVVSARELFLEIVKTQQERSMPYMVYKDTVNRYSMQHNIGLIRSSNLCTEVMEVTSPTRVAVCNLASVPLNRHCIGGRPPIDLPPQYDYHHHYDFNGLHISTYETVVNLCTMILRSKLPIEEARLFNEETHALGTGVQGFQDALFEMRLPYESRECYQWNIEVFETMYHAALMASIQMAKEHGVYQYYRGSHYEKGVLHFDLYGYRPSPMYKDWDQLKEQVKSVGVFNSLLLALMPTAATSHLLGNYEGFAPQSSNVFIRQLLKGEFPEFNKYLVSDLQSLGLWNEEMSNDIINSNGSIQQIERIPQSLKQLYKTCWEVSTKASLDLAIARQPLIDQGQSFECFMESPTPEKVVSMHMHGWRNGLKTGCYYLRTKPPVNAVSLVSKKVDIDTTANLSKKRSIEKVDLDDPCGGSCHA